MQLEYTPEQRAFRAEVRGWMDLLAEDTIGRKDGLPENEPARKIGYPITFD